MIMSIETEKAYNKFNTLLWLKKTEETRNKRKLPQHNKRHIGGQG